MANNRGLPETTYNELTDLLGKEAAEKFVRKVCYDFRLVTFMILWLRFKRLRKEKVWLFVLILVIIFGLAFYYLLNVFFII